MMESVLSNDSRFFDERRGFKRMDAECKVVFRVTGTEKLHRGISKDLSGTGVSFETDIDIEAAQAIDISIQPELNSIQPLNAIAEVIRCSAIGGGRFVIAAVIKTVNR